MTWRGRIGWALAGVGAALTLWLGAGVVLCETAVHVPKRATPETSSAHTDRQTVQITASDGAVLRAWFFIPENNNGNSVLVLHGISDSRAGVMGLARLFVENRYAVLAPDNRGHGESGGEIATYGLREADDVQRWVDWIIATEHPGNVYGMGESLGAECCLKRWRVSGDSARWWRNARLRISSASLGTGWHSGFEALRFCSVRLRSRWFGRDSCMRA